MVSRHVRGAAIATLTAIVMAPLASALVEAPQNAEFEIPLPMPDFDPFQYQTAATLSLSQDAANDISASIGGQWQVMAWNASTATPYIVIGSGVEMGTDLSTDTGAVAAARRAITSSPTLRADLESLELRYVRRSPNKVGVHFDQMFEGLPVLESRVHLVFHENGKLMAMGSNYHTAIDVNPSPSLSARAATDIATSEVLFQPGTDSIDRAAELFVLPIHRTPVDIEYHLVWRIRVRTEDPIGIWVTHVDAHTGEVVWRYNDVHFFDVSGDARQDVQDATYCNGATTQGHQHLRVDVSGLGSVVTDADGNWNAGDGGTGTRTVSCDMEGPYCDTNNVGGAEAFFTGTATAGTPFTIEFDDTNSNQDERDVFDAVNDIHDFMETIDPGFTYWNQSITGNVRLPDVCNAYWDGSINFYPEGGGCANTGEIQGVVHHEFGHGLQDALLGAQGQQGSGEGNGDIIANIMTQESTIGRGFNLGDCVNGIRDSNNSLVYPDDVVGQEIHAAGRVIAGFHWDLMTYLQLELGESAGTTVATSLWHFGRKVSTPTNQPAQVLSVFIEDDDDGDLLNGTPHCEVINQAALNHGFSTIACGVEIVHQHVDSRTTGGSVTIDADVVSADAAVDQGTVLLHYRVGAGSFTEVLMSPDGGDAFTADISGLVDSDEVQYFLTAADLDGNDSELPFGAPTLGVFQFDIATIWQDHEIDHGWIVNPDGTDNAITGTWERVDPVGTAAQPSSDHTSFGTMCFVTGQQPAGGDLGTNDVDDGTTTLQSNPIDLAGAAAAKVKYWRWYSNNTGATPGTDTWITQVRNNGGPWEDIENTMSSSSGWDIVVDDLSARFGILGTVEFRFIASDLGDGSLVEAAIDDFAILTNAVTVGVEGVGMAPRATFLANARPNPFNPHTTIGFGLHEETDVMLAIFDVSGRLVTTLVDGRYAAGEYRASWDGTDVNGSAVSSGVYYSRLTTRDGVTTQKKLTLLR